MWGIAPPDSKGGSHGAQRTCNDGPCRQSRCRAVARSVFPDLRPGLSGHQHGGRCRRYGSCRPDERRHRGRCPGYGRDAFAGGRHHGRRADRPGRGQPSLVVLACGAALLLLHPRHHRRHGRCGRRRALRAAGLGFLPLPSGLRPRRGPAPSWAPCWVWPCPPTSSRPALA